MRPLLLNDFGDTIYESRTHGVKVGETWGLESMVAKHQCCEGEISVVRISETFRSVNCASCGRLLVVPSYVRTVGQLRAHRKGVMASRGSGRKNR